MTKELAISELKKLIEAKGFKKAEVEDKLGMPKNSLSNFLNGNKELPDKWVMPIESYLNRFKEECPVPPVITNTKMVVDKTGFKEKPKREYTDEVMDKINKDFGEGTVMRFGDKPNTGYQTISTGSLQLDIALGIGGLPRGRMVEIFGAESSGKTTIALNVIADAQRQGLKCLMIDAENSFDPEYAYCLGVNIEELDYCQPSYGEQGLEVADRYISEGKADVVIIDSVAALVPKAEIEGEMGDQKMGLHARLMSQACRKLVGSVAKHNVLLLFINQIRNKIGVIYGSPEVTTGGMALQFYASVRLSVSRSTTNENSVMNGKVKMGNQTTVKVIKNKCSPPFKSAIFDIIYGIGIDKTSDLIDAAVGVDVIKRAGAWYSYNENKLGMGAAAVKDILESNEELKNEIELAVKSSIHK